MLTNLDLLHAKTARLENLQMHMQVPQKVTVSCAKLVSMQRQVLRGALTVQLGRARKDPATGHLLPVVTRAQECTLATVQLPRRPTLQSQIVVVEQSIGTNTNYQRSGQTTTATIAVTQL